MHKTSVFLAAALAAPISASAAIIDFGPLENLRQVPYLGHVEDGFSITPTSGDWRDAQFFGQKVPSVFSRSDDASIGITATDGSLFIATAFDIGNGAFNRPGSVSFMAFGWLGDTEVFSLSGIHATENSFLTVLTGSDALIDRFEIFLDGRDTPSFNIDNIVVDIVAAVPLPANALLLGTALGFMGVRASKKRKKSV